MPTRTLPKLSGMLLGLVAVLNAPSFSLAQNAVPPKLISVSGEAQVNVVPDEVYLYLGVETFDKDLSLASKQNEAIVKKALDLTKEFKIDPKYVQTDYISVAPKYDNVYDQSTQSNKNVLSGYFVRKSVSVCLKDISKFEELLNRSLEVGVNYVHGVQFRTTELRKYRDQARAMAIRAAREKAENLAKELDVKIGKPTTISEYGSGWWSEYGSWWGGAGFGYSGGMAQNVMQNAASVGTSSEDAGAVSFGQIRVTANVSVAFEIL